MEASVDAVPADTRQEDRQAMLAGQQEPVTTANNFTSPNTEFSSETIPGLPNLAAGSGPFQWQAPWGDPSFTLCEPTDLQQWEQVLDSITQDQMLFGLQ